MVSCALLQGIFPTQGSNTAGGFFYRLNHQGSPGFPEWLHQFTFPPRVYKGSLFSASSPALVTCGLFEDSCSDRCEVIPHVVLICCPLMTSSDPFMYLFAIAFPLVEGMFESRTSTLPQGVERRRKETSSSDSPHPVTLLAVQAHCLAHS